VGLAIAVSLVAIGAVLALVASGWVTQVHDRVQRSGLVWFACDGTQVHAHVDRRHLPQAEELCRRCRERGDPQATVQPTHGRHATVAGHRLGTWIVAACVVAAIAAAVAYRSAGRAPALGVPPVARPAPSATPAAPLAEATAEQRAAALAEAPNAQPQRTGYGDVAGRVGP